MSGGWTKGLSYSSALAHFADNDSVVPCGYSCLLVVPSCRDEEPEIVGETAVFPTAEEAYALAKLWAAAPELADRLAVARDQIVALMIPGIGAEAAVKQVADIDALLAKAKGQPS